MKFKSNIETTGNISGKSISNILIIKTQKEFEDFVEKCNTNNLSSNITSVWFDGSEVKDIGFISEEKGIKLPLTLKEIQGINNIKIVINNLLLEEGGIYYETLPDENNYYIKNLTLVINTTPPSSALICKGGFYNCVNLTNCVSTFISKNTGNICGFNNCKNLINCKGSGNGESFSHGFYKCYNLINCIGLGIGKAINTGFNSCLYLINCIGTGTKTDSESNHKGYSFYQCSYCSNCKQNSIDPSTTDVWGDKNTFVDYATCDKNADGTIPGNTRQIPDSEDTKNTAGASATSDKIYLIGSKTQATNPKTYTNSEVFVDTMGQIHSRTSDLDENSTVVATTEWTRDFAKFQDTEIIKGEFDFTDLVHTFIMRRVDYPTIVTVWGDASGLAKLTIRCAKNEVDLDSSDNDIASQFAVNAISGGSRICLTAFIPANYCWSFLGDNIKGWYTKTTIK